MEEITYPFGKDIDLTDLKKSETCLPLVTEQPKSPENFNLKRDLETFETESTTTNTSTKQSNQNDESLGMNISPVPSINRATDGIKSDLENQSKYENPEDLFPAEHIIPMVEIRPEPFKGSGRLVRLQAVSTDPPVQPATAADDKTSGNKEEPPENSNKSVGGSHFKDTPMHSESDYQFLTPKIPTSRHQVLTSSNNQFADSNFHSVLSASQTCSTPISSYESPPLNRFAAPHSDNTIIRFDKVPSHPSNDGKIPAWMINSSSSCDSSTSSLNMSGESSFQFSANAAQDPSPIFPGDSSDGSNPPQMQRFLTADNQIVYGFKDSTGEFHFFCNNERESHNEKERKRRSRVSEACNALRKLVPGMSDKTDKATVFEQAASYLKFLREKFGMQFDQAYCEKYFQERS